MSEPSNNHTLTQAKTPKRKKKKKQEMKAAILHHLLLPSTSLITVNFPSSPPQINLTVGGGKKLVCRYTFADI